MKKGGAQKWVWRIIIGVTVLLAAAWVLTDRLMI
jgi:hypothetical protein